MFREELDSGFLLLRGAEDEIGLFLLERIQREQDTALAGVCATRA